MCRLPNVEECFYPPSLEAAKGETEADDRVYFLWIEPPWPLMGLSAGSEAGSPGRYDPPLLEGSDFHVVRHCWQPPIWAEKYNCTTCLLFGSHKMYRHVPPLTLCVLSRDGPLAFECLSVRGGWRPGGKESKQSTMFIHIHCRGSCTGPRFGLSSRYGLSCHVSDLHTWVMELSSHSQVFYFSGLRTGVYASLQLVGKLIKHHYSSLHTF